MSTSRFCWLKGKLRENDLCIGLREHWWLPVDKPEIHVNTFCRWYMISFPIGPRCNDIAVGRRFSPIMTMKTPERNVFRFPNYTVSGKVAVEFYRIAGHISGEIPWLKNILEIVPLRLAPKTKFNIYFVAIISIEKETTNDTRIKKIEASRHKELVATVPERLVERYLCTIPAIVLIGH